MKVLMILGLCLTIAGTAFVGFIAQEGIPKRGDLIKAPKRKLSYIGWGLILLGFVAQLVATIME